MGLEIEVAYWVWFFVVALSLAYVLAFDRATLYVGRLISHVEGGTGLQDAITPPGHTTASLLVYAIWFAGACYWIWQIGWLAGAGGGFGVLVVAGLVSGFFPAKDSSFFMRKINRSMAARHRAFARRGDRMRAAAMADLLERLELRMFNMGK